MSKGVCKRVHRKGVSFANESPPMNLSTCSTALTLSIPQNYPPTGTDKLTGAAVLEMEPAMLNYVLASSSGTYFPTCHACADQVLISTMGFSLYCPVFCFNVCVCVFENCSGTA